MVAVDTNLLVYAYRADAPFHAGARAVIDALVEGAARWAIPWPCVHEFIAIVTHPRIFAPPTPMGRALEQVEAWMESPSLTLLAEGPGYWSSLGASLRGGKVSGPRVHDARVAALCAHHGVTELWSADRDFGRFAGVRVRNPLVDEGRQ